MWSACFPAALSKLALVNLDSVQGPVAMALITACKEQADRWVAGQVAVGAHVTCRDQHDPVHSSSCLQASLCSEGAVLSTVVVHVLVDITYSLHPWSQRAASAWVIHACRCQQLCSPDGQTVLQALLGAVMDPNAPEDAGGNEWLNMLLAHLVLERGLLRELLICLGGPSLERVWWRGIASRVTPPDMPYPKLLSIMH
jgi:hypothetical protein